MKQKMLQAYMDTAYRFAELSHARRLHVGAIVVKDDRIISIGYNGMPAGWDNNCEYEVTEFQTEYGIGSKLVKTGELKTKPEVLHAETNAIAKLARSSESGLGADIFITHSPCLDCAKLIYQSGIKRVYFGKQYRNSDGVDFLKKSGVEVFPVESSSD
jgi:dCMP deaminase